MNNFFNKIIMPALFAAIFVPSLVGAMVFDFDCKSDSRLFVDSTRKDYYDRIFSTSSMIPTIESRQYDKIFSGVMSDIELRLNGDLRDTHFLDFEEKLLYKKYSLEDQNSFDLNSLKTNEVDHQFKVSWGAAVGKSDFFNLVYYNNIVNLPQLEALSYSSNRGKLLFNHKFSNNLMLNLKGNYEERLYDKDPDADYSEAGGVVELMFFSSGSEKYQIIANSLKGEKSTFAKAPGNIKYSKVVEHYTDWERNPNDPDPLAKYISKKGHGNLHLRLFLDSSAKDYTTIDNRSNQTGVGFEATYEFSDDISLNLYDRYSKTDYRRQSAIFFHNDHNSNNFLLSASYEYSPNLSQSLTLYNDFFKHDRAPEEDYKSTQVFYEALYSEGRVRASALIGGGRKTYEQSRLWYPNEEEKKLLGRYDYKISEGFRFKLISEYLDLSYLDNLDILYSDYKQNTWLVAVERLFSLHNSLEIAYKLFRERHEVFYENNLEEKSLLFSWYNRF